MGMGLYEKRQKEFKRTVLWLGVVIVIFLAGLIYVIVSVTDSKVDITTAALYKEFTVAQGQTVLLNDKSISVTLVQVVSDSRCPIDAFCIQMGAATVRLEVQTAGERKTLTFATDNEEPQFVGAYEIRLVRVLPHPGTTDLEVPLEKKVAVLIVSPN